MTTARILDAEPVLDVVPADAPPPRKKADPTLAFLAAAGGWLWRLVVGCLCGMNYFTAVVLVGWLNRLVQARVLHAWWKMSKLARTTTFQEFCAGLGPDRPVLRPRWILRENFTREDMRAELNRKSPDGEPPGWFRQLGRLVIMPFRSLYDNVAIGLMSLLGIFLITGWGCMLMTFSWEFGWLNSFTKGYEVAFVGPATGIGGLLLFAVALMYVPMAQAHMAVTGDFRSFFEFRVVWRLIRARVTPYVILLGMILFFGVVQEVFKTVPAFFDGFLENWTQASDAEIYKALQTYYMVSSAVLFLSLLITHLLAGRIYRSALFKAIRKGRITREMLHPRLKDWFDRLRIYPEIEPAPQGLERVVRSTARWVYRKMAFAALFFLCLFFGMKVYLGEFLNYHPYVGFLNHPMIQLPHVNYTPAHLSQSDQ